MLRHGQGYQLPSKGIDTRAIQAYLGRKNIQHTVLCTKLDATRLQSFGKDLKIPAEPSPYFPPGRATL
jgi:site-specific recombinase XerD